MALISAFLSALPVKTRDLIKSHLTEVKLERGATLARPHSKLEIAYLPIDCVLSVDIEISDGVTFCTGLIGSDGLLGAGMSLDDRVCLYGVSALTGGSAFVLTMSRLKELLLEIPEFRKRALAYDQFSWRRSSKLPLAVRCMRLRHVLALGSCGCRNMRVTRSV